MARVVKSKEPHHRIMVKGDVSGEVNLIRGGKRRAYLWAGGSNGGVVTVSGEKTLRALALAILAEVGR